MRDPVLDSLVLKIHHWRFILAPKRLEEEKWYPKLNFSVRVGWHETFICCFSFSSFEPRLQI